MTASVFGLKADGLNGLEPCTVVPAEALLSPAPSEKGEVFFAEGSQTCGIWEATPYAERMENYPFNEFAQVLSGKVVITPDEGEAKTFIAGDTYVMRKGFTGRFEVVETCRKYYFTVE